MLNTILLFACAAALVVAVVMEVRLHMVHAVRRGCKGHEAEAQVRYLGGRGIKHGRAEALERAVLDRVDEILGAELVSLRSEYDHCGVKCWTVTSNKGSFSYVTSNEWVDPDYIVSSPAVAKVYRMSAGSGSEVDDVLLWQESIFIEGEAFNRLRSLYDSTPSNARLAYLDDMDRQRKLSEAKTEVAHMAVVFNMPLSKVKEKLAEAAGGNVTEAQPEPKAEPKEEPKAEPKAEPKEEPKAEPKDEPKAEPKDEPKEKPKAEPKVGAKRPRTKGGAARKTGKASK